MGDSCVCCERPCDTSRTDFDPRSPVCADCQPIRQHVVSMQTGTERRWLGVCPCGWSYGADDNAVREQAVRQHWREVVAEARG